MPDTTSLSEPPPHLVEAQKKASGSKASSERSFDFNWTAPNGDIYQGAFVSRVPNIGQQIDIAKSVARRAQSDIKLPDDVHDLIYTVAYLNVALIKRPDWASNLDDLPYVELLNGLAEEATAHLQAFRRR